MAEESNFIATSPILAKILKGTQGSSEKKEDVIDHTSFPNKGNISPPRNAEKSQATSFQDFMNKLQSSPRRSTTPTKSHQSNDLKEEIQAATYKQRNTEDHDIKGRRSNSSQPNLTLEATGKSSEQKSDATRGENMAWKSDLHGFYQPSRNEGFLLKFNGFDEGEEAVKEESDKIEISVIDHGSFTGHNEHIFGFEDKSDDGFLQNEVNLKDEDIDVDALQKLRGIPLLFIQPPTPSDLSRGSSSIGSSRPETPGIVGGSELANDVGNIDSDTDDVPNSVSLGECKRNENDVFDAQNGIESDAAEGEERNKRQPFGFEDEVSPLTNVLIQNEVSTSREMSADSVSSEREASGEEESEDEQLTSYLEGIEDPNESAGSIGHANNSLLTSWSEQQIRSIIPRDNFSDTVSFVHRTESSPTITWGSTVDLKSRDASINDRECINEDILQTSIGSATDLREVLERGYDLTGMIEDSDNHFDGREGYQNDKDFETELQGSEEYDSRIDREDPRMDRNDDQYLVNNAEPVKAEIEREEEDSYKSGRNEKLHSEKLMQGNSINGSHVNGLERVQGRLIPNIDEHSAEQITQGEGVELKIDKAIIQDENELMNDVISGRGSTDKDAKETKELNSIGDYVGFDATSKGLYLERLEEQISGILGHSVEGDSKPEVFTEGEIINSYNGLLSSWTNESKRGKSWEYPMISQLEGYSENLEVFSLLRSLELERARFEAVKELRLKLEETCNQIPIEKIPSFVYEKWQDLLERIVDHGNSSFQELEAEHEDSLRGMRLELDQLTKDNFDLSRVAKDVNSYKLDNDLLRKQVDGLDDYVSSLERRLEGRAKDTSKIVEETELLRAELIAKEGELKNRVHSFEEKVTDLTNELNQLKGEKMNLENDIKIKEIEYKKVLNENERIKDEIQIDIEKVNANSNSLRNKIVELQQDNETLKTATEADQAVIKHLETKLQKSNDLIREFRNEKSKLLAELQESKVREADLRKDKQVLTGDIGALGKQKEGLTEKVRLLNEEKRSVEQQLNAKLNEETKSTDAMLRELKSLESSLNSVRQEKSILEDKYNNQKFELERLYMMLKIKKHKKPNEGSHTAERRPESMMVAGGLLGSAMANANGHSSAGFVDLSDARQSSDLSRSFNSSTTRVVTDSFIKSDNNSISDASSQADESETLCSSEANISSLPSQSNERFSNFPFSSSRLPSKSSRSVSRSHTLESATSQDSDTETIDSYPDFPNKSASNVLRHSVSDDVSIPDVMVVRSYDSPSRTTTRSSPFSASHRRKDRIKKQETEVSSGQSTKYSADDTRSWLKSMETKLEQTDQIMKAMKKSKPIQA